MLKFFSSFSKQFPWLILLFFCFVARVSDAAAITVTPVGSLVKHVQNGATTVPVILSKNLSDLVPVVPGVTITPQTFVFDIHNNLDTPLYLDNVEDKTQNNKLTLTVNEELSTCRDGVGASPIPANQDCRLVVTASPTELDNEHVAESESAQLSIDTAIPSQITSPAMTVVVNPSSGRFTFSNHVTGQSAETVNEMDISTGDEGTLTISNSGDAVISDFAVDIPSAIESHIMDNTCANVNSLAAGASCEIEYNFTNVSSSLLNELIHVEGVSDSNQIKTTLPVNISSAGHLVFEDSATPLSQEADSFMARNRFLVQQQKSGVIRLVNTGKALNDITLSIPSTQLRNYFSDSSTCNLTGTFALAKNGSCELRYNLSDDSDVDPLITSISAVSANADNSPRKLKVEVAPAWQNTNGPFGGPTIASARSGSTAFISTLNGVYQREAGMTDWDGASDYFVVPFDRDMVRLDYSQAPAFALAASNSTAYGVFFVVMPVQYWAEMLANNQSPFFTGVFKLNGQNAWQLISPLGGFDDSDEFDGLEGALTVANGKIYFAVPGEDEEDNTDNKVYTANLSDDTHWTALSSANITSNDITQLIVHDSTLFALTDTASGPNIYKYVNDTSGWEAVGSVSKINDLVVYNNNLYAAKIAAANLSDPAEQTFTLYALNNAADGWTSILSQAITLPSIFAGTSFTSMVSVGNELYIAVNNAVYRLNGDSLDPAGTVPAHVFDDDEIFSHLFSDGANLYYRTLTGVFKYTVTNDTWTADNSGVDATIASSVLSDDGSLYAGTISNGVFKRNGNAWDSFNAGLPGVRINHLASFDGALYASIITYDNTADIYKNTGSGWVVANSGLPEGDVIDVLQATNDSLYAGTATGRVYRLSAGSSTWTEVGADTESSMSLVTSIASVGGQLFVGTESNLYRLTNGVWTPLFSEDTEVYSMVNYDGLIYLLIYQDGAEYQALCSLTAQGVLTHIVDFAPQTISFYDNFYDLDGVNMAVNTSNNTLYVLTAGSGVYRFVNGHFENMSDSGLPQLIFGSYPGSFAFDGGDMYLGTTDASVRRLALPSTSAYQRKTRPLFAHQ